MDNADTVVIRCEMHWLTVKPDAGKYLFEVFGRGAGWEDR
jgi:hypothetical protein